MYLWRLKDNQKMSCIIIKIINLQKNNKNHLCYFQVSLSKYIGLMLRYNKIFLSFNIIYNFYMIYKVYFILKTRRCFFGALMRLS